MDAAQVVLSCKPFANHGLAALLRMFWPKALQDRVQHLEAAPSCSLQCDKKPEVLGEEGLQRAREEVEAGMVDVASMSASVFSCSRRAQSSFSPLMATGAERMEIAFWAIHKVLFARSSPPREASSVALPERSAASQICYVSPAREKRERSASKQHQRGNRPPQGREANKG